MTPTARRSPRLFVLLVAALAMALPATMAVPSAHAQCAVQFCTDCPSDPTCAACAPGFDLRNDINETSCNDINECATANGGCSVSAGCGNTVGSRSCTCFAGFTGDGVQCNDVNECATANGGCAVTAACTNTSGSRNCTCNVGFTGNGVQCNDINECATNNGGCASSPEGSCANTAGSRTCQCSGGYTGDGTLCLDVNECAIANGGCSADPPVACTNLQGSSACGSCPTGYSGDGRSCGDINECATSNGGCAAGPAGACANTAGSRNCTCTPGFSGNGLACADINECAVNGGGCDTLTTCTNVPGSRDCSSCPSGYTGTGATACNDVNECTSGTACNAGTCNNSPGAFDCDCLPGVTGDACEINGYVPPDKPTAACESGVSTNIVNYVKCLTKCRVSKAKKALAGQDFDEQGCALGPKSCRTKYDKKMQQLVDKGTCPACLDQAAQSGIADDARTAVIGLKGRTYCSGTEPLAP